MNHDFKITANNDLLISYVLDADATDKMQEDSLAKAKEISDSIIKDGMSDYEKEIAINDYLCENAAYNDKILEAISDEGTIDDNVVYEYPNSFTPYGILCENVGVCESYAEAFLLIAQECGLEAIIETGKMQNVNHEWNRVKLDGGWYMLDVTNNDSDMIKNMYVNLPDDVASLYVQKSTEAYMDNVASEYTSEGMDYEYYNVNGLYSEEKAWLLTVATNRGKSILNLMWNRRTQGLDALEEASYEDKHNEGYAYEYVMKLPEKYRVAINLFYYEQLKTDEIAKIMKTKETTVRSYLHRGRERLKEMMEADA